PRALRETLGSQKVQHTDHRQHAHSAVTLDPEAQITCIHHGSAPQSAGRTTRGSRSTPTVRGEPARLGYTNKVAYRIRRRDTRVQTQPHATVLSPKRRPKQRDVPRGPVLPARVDPGRRAPRARRGTA